MARLFPALLLLCLSALQTSPAAAFKLSLGEGVQAALGGLGELLVYIGDYRLTKGASLRVFRSRGLVTTTVSPVTSTASQVLPPTTSTAHPFFFSDTSSRQESAPLSSSSHLFSSGSSSNQNFQSGAQSNGFFPPPSSSKQLSSSGSSASPQAGPSSSFLAGSKTSVGLFAGSAGKTQGPMLPGQSSGAAMLGQGPVSGVTAGQGRPGAWQGSTPAPRSAPELLADVSINGSVVLRRAFHGDWQGRASVRSTGSKVLFKVTDVTLQDEGVYSVYVTVNGVTQSDDVSLLVAVPPSWASLYTSSPPSFNERTSVNFTCSGLAGRPGGHVRFGKVDNSGGTFLPVAAPVVSRRITQLGNGSSLVEITFQREIQREDDDANFACVIYPDSYVFYGSGHVTSAPVRVSVNGDELPPLPRAVRQSGPGRREATSGCGDDGGAEGRVPRATTPSDLIAALSVTAMTA